MNAPCGNVFERQFANQLESLSGVIEEAVRFLEERGVQARTVHVAHLAIEEMATNILKYGYDDTALHQILLRVQMDPGALLVVIEDDGHEFNPLETPQPDLQLPPEQREPGGLGIHLVRSLAAQMHYQRCGGRNRLTVRIAS
jgi:serine/threonine-protein kinase RsbW